MTSCQDPLPHHVFPFIAFVVPSVLVMTGNQSQVPSNTLSRTNETHVLQAPAIWLHHKSGRLLVFVERVFLPCQCSVLPATQTRNWTMPSVIQALQPYHIITNLPLALLRRLSMFCNRPRLAEAIAKRPALLGCPTHLVGYLVPVQ